MIPEHHICGGVVINYATPAPAKKKTAAKPKKAAAKKN
jgi:hypothetical protein